MKCKNCTTTYCGNKDCPIYKRLELEKFKRDSLVSELEEIKEYFIIKDEPAFYTVVEDAIKEINEKDRRKT